jgi:hypothetical protein
LKTLCIAKQWPISKTFVQPEPGITKLAQTYQSLTVFELNIIH